MDALIANARFHFHKRLFETNTLTLTTAGVASNADTSSRGSKAIARRIVDILVEEQHHAVSTVDKISGQTLGKQFETLTMEFLRETFPYLQNLRPGNWTILQLGNNNKLKTSDFAQYEHLAYLNALTTQNAQLAAALGNDYLVAPDVVVYRDLYEDSEINAAQTIVDDEICKMADIRKSNGGKPILHASVSAKYTMRSDRAQNSRTEALNLIRNRKGHLPHIVVVTAEPMPNRLASLALGTGDIDCVYHFALYELIRAVKEAGSEDAVETLETLVQGKRLKDISDLPLAGVIAAISIFTIVIHLLIPVNTAIVAVLLPALATLAGTMGVNPAVLAIPMGFSVSAALLLPLDPVPLVTYPSGYYKMFDMFKPGCLISVVWVVVMTLIMFAIAVPLDLL